MPSGEKLARRARRLPIAALVLAFALLPASASGLSRGPGASDLSPRLAELAKPSVRSAPEPVQAAKLSLAAEGPGSLLRRGNRVLIYVRFDRGAAADLGALREAGAKIVDVSRRYQTVTVAAKPAELRQVAAVPRVAAVSEVLTPIVHAAGGPGPVTSVYTPCFGLETSEGDEQLRANEARAKYEVEGAGVKVGVLSDSFDQDPFAPTGAAEDVASGDLPGPGNPCGHTTPVKVLDDTESEGADEGRAMAQIVHDLAPGAALSFATAFTGELSFADNIRALAKAGAKAIVDDVVYFEEPFFQDGPIAVAVNEVTAEDVAYFSAAGNENLLEEKTKNSIGSWEAPKFRDSGKCPSGVPSEYETHCMDFDPGVAVVDPTFGVTVSNGGTLNVELQWAQPWNGVTTDLDMYLLNQANQVVASSVDFNVTEPHESGFFEPFEFMSWTNTTGSTQKVRIAIPRCNTVCDPENGGDTGTPPLKFIFPVSDGVTATEYPESSEGDIVGPTIFGHSGAAAAMSVGAISFNTTTVPESFSSEGPVTHYFDPVEGTEPAKELGAPPQVIAKPDVVATDGGANTFFGVCVEGAWRFFGTSAAAPHAAAVAAIARGEGAKPAASAEEVEEAQRKAAAPVGAFPPEAVGSGLVDAVGTLEELGVTPPAGATLVEPPAPGPCLPPREPVGPPPSSSPAPLGPPPPVAGTTRLRTFFRSRPPKLIRTRLRQAKAIFVFGANESDVTFVCRIDGGLFRPCPARLVRRFTPGRHSVRAVARDAAGNADETPAVYRFRVKRID